MDNPAHCQDFRTAVITCTTISSYKLSLQGMVVANTVEPCFKGTQSAGKCAH